MRIGKFKYAKALNFLVRTRATKAIAYVILHLDYVELSPCPDAIVVLEGVALRLGASQVFFAILIIFAGFWSFYREKIIVKHKTVKLGVQNGKS
jgi:hypothetical protein